MIGAGVDAQVERSPEPQTHDYTRKTWGHNYEVMAVKRGGMELRLCGWGHGIKEGDYLILENGSGSTRYKVESIAYRTDPPDMWFANAVFAPRQAAVTTTR